MSQSDDFSKKFEEYLKNLSPDQSDKLHKELAQAIKDDEELEEKIARCRVKGLRSKDVMVFEVDVETTCITCGNVVKTKTWSSSTQPIIVTLALCGQCETHLARFTKEELIGLIIQKERAYYSRPKDYMPHYRTPALTTKQGIWEAERDIPDFVENDTTPAHETPLFDGPEEQQFLDAIPGADEEVEE